MDDDSDRGIESSSIERREDGPGEGGTCYKPELVSSIVILSQPLTTSMAETDAGEPTSSGGEPKTFEVS